MHKTHRKKYINILKYLVTLLLLGSLIYAIKQVGLEQILKQLSHAGYYIIPIMLCGVLVHLTSSYAWQLCMLGKHKSISLLKLINYRIISEGFAIINPTNIVGGDAMKYYFISKDGIPKATASYSVITSRILLIISQVILFILSLVIFFTFAHTSANSNTLVQFAKSLGILLAIATLTIFILRQLIKRDSLSKLGIRKPFLLRNMALIKQFYKNKKLFYAALIWSALHWIFGAAELYYIIQATGKTLSPLATLLVDEGIVVLKSLGAFIPAQIGVEEYALKTMLSFVGFAFISLWIPIALLRRIKQIIWIVIGAILYLITQLSLKRTPNKYGNTVRNT